MSSPEYPTVDLLPPSFWSSSVTHIVNVLILLQITLCRSQCNVYINVPYCAVTARRLYVWSNWWSNSPPLHHHFQSMLKDDEFFKESNSPDLSVTDEESNA